MYGEVEDIVVDEKIILKRIFNKLDKDVAVHWSASSYGQVTGSCKHAGLVLRFRNKWSCTSTPPTPAWRGQKFAIFTSQKQRASIIMPALLKACYADIHIEITNTFRAGKTERFRDVPPGGIQSVGGISVTIHQLREFRIPPQGEGW